MKKKFESFSVPLGLLDYGNPVFYTVTMVTILRNIYGVMDRPFNVILLMGAIISIFFGLVIPTGKVIVGLGLIEFRMPVSLVACVNTGILISGLMMLRHVLELSLPALLIILLLAAATLYLIYTKSKKFNTVAVMTGAIGYMLLYVSLIILSVERDTFLPILFYVLAIFFFFMLCGIGIKADLKNPKVHWVIEVSNVMCQFLVAVGTVILFTR
ncbi:MAG: hypothetical protein IJH69_03255 [Firmicutes bacterium]|nr:hypothetical protein [Bacillota bacterium]MBQ6608107.1 hypothetical protein [Bacillota bacterium]